MLLRMVEIEVYEVLGSEWCFIHLDVLFISHSSPLVFLDHISRDEIHLKISKGALGENFDLDLVSPSFNCSLRIFTAVVTLASAYGWRNDYWPIGITTAMTNLAVHSHGGGR